MQNYHLASLNRVSCGSSRNSWRDPRSWQMQRDEEVHWMQVRKTAIVLCEQKISMVPRELSGDWRSLVLVKAQNAAALFVFEGLFCGRDGFRCRIGVCSIFSCESVRRRGFPHEREEFSSLLVEAVGEIFGACCSFVLLYQIVAKRCWESIFLFCFQKYFFLHFNDIYQFSFEVLTFYKFFLIFIWIFLPLLLFFHSTSVLGCLIFCYFRGFVNRRRSIKPTHIQTLFISFACIFIFPRLFSLEIK